MNRKKLLALLSMIITFSSQEAFSEQSTSQCISEKARQSILGCPQSGKTQPPEQSPSGAGQNGLSSSQDSLSHPEIAPHVSPHQGLARRELTESETKTLESIRRSMCKQSDRSSLAKLTYRGARIYYSANQWEEAAVLFEEIAYNHSAEELALFAVNLYLDSLNAISRLDKNKRPSCREKLSQSVAHFLQDKNLTQHEELRDQLSILQCGILWIEADSFFEANQYEKAAKNFMKIYNDHRSECQVIGTHNICEVLYNAAINYEFIGEFSKAISTREILIQECGHNSEYAKQHGTTNPNWVANAMYQIGGNYHTLMDFEKAAVGYERFARLYPAEKQAPEALRNAIVFRISLGHDEKAIKNSQLFEKNYARRFDSETASIVFSVGTIYMRNKAWDLAGKHYRSFLARYGRSASLDEQIQAYTNLGFALWKQAEKVKKQNNKLRSSALKQFHKVESLADTGRTEGESLRARIVRYKKQLGITDHSPQSLGRLRRTLESVAKSRFYIAEDAFKSLAGSPQTKTLEQVEKLYLKTVEEDIPEWEMASAMKLGDLYLSAHQNSDENREKAIGAYRHCHDLALQNRWYNANARKCQQMLTKLQPRIYPDDEELFAQPNFIFSPLASPKMVKTSPLDTKQKSAD